MRADYRIAMVLLTGVAIGGLAVEGLRAQARGPVYLVSEIDVKDPEAYAKDYAPKAQAVIKAAGGRILAIGGAAANGGKVTALDGDAPKRVVVQVWDSMEKIKAWRASPEFIELRKMASEKHAIFRSFAVDGVAE